MKFRYTKHAEEKLQRPDIKSFKITKEKIEATILFPHYAVKTQETGESIATAKFEEKYILRVIYDKIGKEIKVITFHIAKRGRYGT